MQKHDKGIYGDGNEKMNNIPNIEIATENNAYNDQIEIIDLLKRDIYFEFR